jgi:hypothetical protein
MGIRRSNIPPLNNFYHRLSIITSSDSTRIYITVYIVLAVIVMDTVLNRNSELRTVLKDSGLSVAFFVICGIIAIVGQFYIIQFVRQKSSQIRKKVAYLGISYRIVSIIQYLIIAIFAFVLVEIIIMWQYPSISLAIVTAAAYGLNIGLMIVFTQVFLTWYRSNRNSIVVLLYGLSFAAVIIASAIYLTGSIYRFVEKPLIVSADTVPLAKTEPGSLLYHMSRMYHYSGIFSFLMMWISTVLLLYHYSQKMGGAKYWILISLPLVYLAGTYLDDYHIYEPHAKTEKLYWYLYTSLNSTAGGILFYIAFIVAAKPFHRSLAIKDYMIMSGFGFLLFFSAGQSSLTNTLYPPFGLATMSLYGLSTYMILLGLYSSAVSVSQDNKLRGSIKRIARKNSNLLGSIGTAQMEREIQRTVNSMKNIVEEQEKEMEEQTGIEANLEEDEMKKYLEEVMQEVGKAKKPST